MSQLSRTWAGLMCGLMLASTGCATLNIPFVTDRVPKASTRNPVTQIVCIWQPSEGRDPSGMPCRGFAGQILFLANRGSLPVQVDGDVRIYLFDDHGTVEDQAKPLHLYNFDSKSWAIHLTKGTLGPTYSVFVPYTRRGNYEAKCALRVRMTGPNGEAVFSDLATISLDGKKNSGDASADVNDADLATEAKAATEAVSNAMRRTTTISMSGETTKPKPGHTLSDSPAPNNEAPSGRVQLANYEVGRSSSDPGAQRIEQLEELVQQLLEQQRVASKSGPPTESPSRQNDSLPPHPLTAEARGRHPLDNDEEAEKSESQRTVTRPRRTPDSHHPLAALDEELSQEETFRKQPTKSPSQPLVKSREDSTPSTHPLRAAEQTERTWSDPFEPISTDAIETTSVAPETIRRQRLRAAR